MVNPYMTIMVTDQSAVDTDRQQHGDRAERGHEDAHSA